MTLFEIPWLNNEIASWALALLITVLAYFVLSIIKRFIVRRLRVLAQKTSTDLDDLIANLLDKTHFLAVLALSLYIGFRTVSLSLGLTSVFEKGMIIVWVWQFAVWGNHLISYWLTRYLKKTLQQDAAAATTISMLGFLSRVVLYTALLLVGLDNLGIEITALVAGLGVGGIAVALAAQNILGDLFASLTIVFDKPFLIGDFIMVGDHLGSIEYIGLKTTRIRSLTGEQLIFSNTDLLNSRIRNYQRMEERRSVFSIGVSYGTPFHKIAAIATILRAIIEDKAHVRFDRAHFKEYGSYSLNFEVVYWVLSPNYALYMDIQQEINLEIFRRFEEEGIQFALPMQNLFVSNGSLLAPTAASKDPQS